MVSQRSCNISRDWNDYVKTIFRCVLFCRLLQPLKSRPTERLIEIRTNGHPDGFMGQEKVCSHRANCYEFNKKVKRYIPIRRKITYDKFGFMNSLGSKTLFECGSCYRTGAKYDSTFQIFENKTIPWHFEDFALYKFKIHHICCWISQLVQGIRREIAIHFFGKNSTCFCLQLLTCLFNSYTGCESNVGNIVSAFLSAIFFYAYPNIPIFAHALACTIEILWQRYHQSSNAPKFTVLQQLNEMPIAKLFYVLACGYLFHVRTFYPWQTPSILMKVMSLVTNDQ